MDGPHVCQRCSGTFVLASSLRTHAAHVHGEGLQAFLAESSCHPSGGFGNHGDTIGDVKPDKIKREICGTDCEADIAKFSAFSVTDSQEQVVDVTSISNGHCKNVDGSHSGNHGDTTCDIKPDMIKAETCDYEVDSVQYNALVTDRPAHAGGVLYGKHNSSSSAIHFNSVGDVKPDMVKVEVCDYEVDSGHHNSLVIDKEAHGGGDLCGKHYNSSSETHLDTVGDIKPDMVKVCDYEVDSVQYKETWDNDVMIVAENNYLSRLKVSKPIHTEDRPYACSVCEKSFNRLSALKSHERIHTGDRPYACNVCEKRFVSSCHLKSHEPIHTGDRPYACNVCEKSFKQLSTLKKHKHIHTGERPHACNVCEERSVCLSHLKVHKRIHTKDKRYACNVCEKRFKRPSTLKVHERIHTGDRPYACNVCEKRFNESSHLKAHKRIHTGDRPYACNVCEKRFVFLSHLKVHERIHTGDRPYACNVCEKGFRQLSTLKMHERIHTGDRPHACNVCEKRFNESSHLKAHERIHTGDRPYACNVCEKSFRQLSALKKHEHTHTGERAYAI